MTFFQFRIEIFDQKAVMEEIEKKFKCPYCFEKISMIIDLSVEGTHTYIEDCEVCCRPIQIMFSVEDYKLSGFDYEGAG